MNPRAFHGGRRLIWVSLALALAGAVALLVGRAVDGRQAAASYLVAYVYVMTVLLGLLFFVLSAHVMGAGWPVAVRRLAESGLGAMPIAVLLFIPVGASLEALYPWTHPERASGSLAELLRHRSPVMNGPFFLIRAVAYLLSFAITAELVRRGSLAMDRPSPPDLRRRLRAQSSAFLPLVGVTGSFAGFDWVMSRAHIFFSTMYGLYVLSGGFLASLGLLALLMWSAERAGLVDDLRRPHWYAIGRLLFAFLIFWGYIGYFQYMIVWLGNKPSEAGYFAERWGRHAATTWFLIYGHFAVPFALLLQYWIKVRRATVSAIGAWLLACHFIDVKWLVGGPWSWQDAAALALVGGLSVACATWRQRGRLVAAVYDPDYERAVAYESR
jgi:hypothetical protein